MRPERESPNGVGVWFTPQVIKLDKKNLYVLTPIRGIAHEETAM